jgi:hypothetical protein
MFKIKISIFYQLPFLLFTVCKIIFIEYFIELAWYQNSHLKKIHKKIFFLPQIAKLFHPWIKLQIFERYVSSISSFPVLFTELLWKFQMMKSSNRISNYPNIIIHRVFHSIYAFLMNGKIWNSFTQLHMRTK